MKCNKTFNETYIFYLNGVAIKRGTRRRFVDAEKRIHFVVQDAYASKDCTNLCTDVNNHNDSTSESNESSSGSDTDLNINSDDDITDILQTEVVTNDFEITELI